MTVGSRLGKARRLARNLLVDALVRSSVVEIMDVLLHDAIGMPFTEDDEVIQTFAPETAQEALADRIGLGRAIGSAEYINARPDSNTRKR